MTVTGINTQHQDEGLVVEELDATDVTATDDVVAIHPLNGKPIVSAASGTNWEGAS